MGSQRVVMRDRPWMRPLSGVMILAAGVALYVAVLAWSWLTYRFGDLPEAPGTGWVLVLTYVRYGIAVLGVVWIVVTAVIQDRRRQ